MTSERQIEANQQNTMKRTAPYRPKFSAAEPLTGRSGDFGPYRPVGGIRGTLPHKTPPIARITLCAPVAAL